MSCYEYMQLKLADMPGNVIAKYARAYTGYPKQGSLHKNS